MLNSKIVFSEFPQQERKEKDLDDKVAQAITHQLQRIANYYVAICIIEIKSLYLGKEITY